MIKIDHTALYVHNLEATKDFFVRFFSAQSNQMYHNPRTGLRSYFLTFGEGTRLEIMNRPEVHSSEKSLYEAGYTHLSFSAGGKENVDKLTQTLSSEGFQILSGPRTTGDGYYESCISGPEGIQVEITE